MPVPIAIRSLARAFGSGPGAIRAVDGVDLGVAPGELFCLLGPSGCGKTTLLRLLAGFLEPTAGAIRFGERDVTRLPPAKRRVGMVFQAGALWPHMTAEQNVAFALRARGVAGQERARRLAESLDAVGLASLAGRKPAQLSGGEQQRVALARALAARPEVLLLDEPLSSLDVPLRRRLRGEVRRVCKEAQTTTISVTHDHAEAMAIADRLAVMRSGRILQIGTPEEVYRRPTSRFVAGFLGEANLLDATVLEGPAAGDSRLAVQTPLGRLRADAPNPSGLAPGSRATIAVRPEALRLERPIERPTTPVAKAVVESSTYLGHGSELLLRLESGEMVKALAPHPTSVRLPRAREQTLVRVDPEDVILLSGVEGDPPMPVAAGAGA